tara:strand:- start:1631 stop:2860 length:1230 start_codon:yes stop_codon:yes gene_type:complete
MDKTLVLFTNNNVYDKVCEYIYNKYNDYFNHIEYIQNIKKPRYDFKTRKNTKQESFSIIRPSDCDISIEYNDKNIRFLIETIYNDKNNIQKLFVTRQCESFDVILQKMTLYSDNKDILIQFVNDSIKYVEDRINSYKKINNDIIRTFYWRQEYWSLFSKTHKRPLDTLYLKNGAVEKIMTKINKFLDTNTRDEYIQYGIPYKSVYLLYGVPGGGKTSLINCIAAETDADIYIIPITSELKDSDLISAFSELSVSDDDKQQIVVIEDIDCIFDERKANDHNNITLQTLLNCLDGLTCVEGLLLFITANKPEVLDYALIRSSRIDHKIEFDYADEYQTENMFCKFFDKSLFKEFYKNIDHLKYTTAMLQEFLFYNRESSNIIEQLSEFNDIVNKNKPENLNNDNKKNNLYM